MTFPVITTYASNIELWVYAKEPGDGWLFVRYTGNTYGWVDVRFVTPILGPERDPCHQSVGSTSRQRKVAGYERQTSTVVQFAVTQGSGTNPPRTDAQTNADGWFYAYLPHLGSRHLGCTICRLRLRVCFRRHLQSQRNGGTGIANRDPAAGESVAIHLGWKLIIPVDLIRPPPKKHSRPSQPLRTSQIEGLKTLTNRGQALKKRSTYERRRGQAVVSLSQQTFQGLA